VAGVQLVVDLTKSEPIMMEIVAVNYSCL